MNSASASGKVILFGEHAVVYGRPALAIPVTQVRATVRVSTAARAGIWIDAPDIHLHTDLGALPPDHPIAAAISNVFATLNASLAEIGRGEGMQIAVSSTIPVASGLGSGAAVTVALIRALSAYLSKPLPHEQVNQLAFEIEKLHHGNPSGIDNTVITYAMPVYFMRGQPIATFKPGKALVFLIADTGIPAPTRESVSDVRKLWENDKARWDGVFDEVGAVVKEARTAIEAGNAGELGELMDRNHALLQQMTVSSPELDRLVNAARKAGARGAKLSGGGRGGNMIALCSKARAEAVSEALTSSGAKHVIETTLQPP